ncbi:hypothetical protein FOA52_013253 [Chlamydomonas sp. UWO 241]|nr:hypothetical protein FOA52_013253 [Chlamydomonas sp. UWO 241]
MATLIAKRAKYTTPAKTTVMGVCSVGPSRVKWEPEEKGAAESVLVVLSAITNQQRAKGKPFLRLVCGTAAHVLQFDSEADRDAVVDCISQAKAPQASVPDAPGMPSRTERQAWLKEDADLAEEYTQMVGSGVLAEPEFWAAKSASLAARVSAGHGPPGGAAEGGGGGAAKASKTGGPKVGTAGLSNRMIEMQAEQDDKFAAIGKTKLNFSLTPDMIAQIFAERPHVRRSFFVNVPHNMSEKEFWTKFMKYEVNKEMRRKRLLGGQSVDDVPEDHAELFSHKAYAGGTSGGGKRVAAAAIISSVTAAGPEKRSKLARVDPVVNLLAHFHDGFAVAPGSSKDALLGQAGGLADDLVRDINRHAEVVLDGVDALRAAGSAAAEAQAFTDQAGSSGRDGAGGGLDDLRAVPVPEYEELRIQDASRYFDRISSDDAAASGAAAAAAAAGDAAASGAEAAAATARLASVEGVRPAQLSTVPIDPGVAYEVLLECSRGVARDVGGVGAAVAAVSNRPPEEVLAPELRTMIRKEVLVVNELCRHFWACVPAGGIAPKADKLARLHAEADKRYDKVEAMCSAAQGPERAVIRQLLKPVRDMLDALIDRYKLDEAPRGRAW